MSLFGDLHEFCRPQVPLAPLTWYRLGGPAEWLVEPRSADELCTVLHRCREAGVPVRLLGLGANLLVRDAGVKGAVVRLAAPFFQRQALAEGAAEAGAGVPLTRLVHDAVRAGLAGLEALAGIPGTVGGGIRMNCGGRYGEIAACVQSVRVATTDGRIRERPAAELGFQYRRAELAGDVVISATLRLTADDPVRLQSRFREIWRYKAEKQPALEKASAGCIFKNPEPERSAGRLIDELGLKGLRRGGAVVSDVHANFIVAEPGAKAADVLALIETVEEQVFARAGVRLEREVEIW